MIKIKVIPCDELPNMTLQTILDIVNNELYKIDLMSLINNHTDLTKILPTVVSNIEKKLDKDITKEEKNINIKKCKIKIDDINKDKSSYRKDPECYCKNPYVDEFKGVLNIDHVI